jgi:hypothetical protein
MQQKEYQKNDIFLEFVEQEFEKNEEESIIYRYCFCQSMV